MAEPKPPPTKDCFQSVPFAINYNDLALIQHISFSPAFEHFSAEELRLADYERGPKTSFTRYGLATYANAKLWTGVRWGPPDHSACPALGGDIVKFVVGTEPSKQFAIHTNLVIPNSDFARLALQKDWKEAKTREIPLPDDDPDIFEIYQLWLYRQHICVDRNIEFYQVMAKAYILGDKLMDVKFKNAVMHWIILCLCQTSQFDLHLTNIIYNNTPPQSPLRRLLRHIYLYTADPTWLDDSTFDEPISSDFLRDLAADQMKLKQGMLPIAPLWLTHGSIEEYNEELALPTIADKPHDRGS